eukprot:SAG11_NODE_52_length_19809_cov_14.064231_4_plen_70_part_00
MRVPLVMQFLDKWFVCVRTIRWSTTCIHVVKRCKLIREMRLTSVDTEQLEMTMWLLAMRLRHQKATKRD